MFIRKNNTTTQNLNIYILKMLYIYYISNFFFFTLLLYFFVLVLDTNFNKLYEKNMREANLIMC